MRDEKTTEAGQGETTSQEVHPRGASARGTLRHALRSMLQADCLVEGKRLPTEQGTPQGGVVSPILSNVLLTPFDCEMRHRGYRLTRYADDWVVTCRTRREAAS